MAANGEDHGINLDDPKVEIAALGKDVEYFIETDPIGQYIVRRARELIEEAQQKLLTVDPEDTRAIRKIQNDARVADLVRGFLAEAIRDGQAAVQLIQQERDDNAN